MPDIPAAIRAAFAEWRMVKSRKVLQLVFEVPLETQGEVLTMLGAPMPDAEIWCGIAKLDSELRGDSQRSRLPIVKASAELRLGVESGSHSELTSRARASQFAKERYANSDQMEQALVRAGALARDVPFIDWCIGYASDESDQEDLIERAAQFIRDYCCEGRSRSLIATDPECWRRFTELEMKYKVGAGRIAEPR